MKHAQPEPDVVSAARRGMRSTAITIVANTLLAGIKIVSGLAGHSYALIADGVESLLDIVGSLVVWGGLRIASQPPNARFPYGYGKAEPLAGLVVATALLATAAGIAVQSIREIRTPHHAPAPFTLVVLVGVVVTKEILFRRMTRTGDEIGSRAVKNDAWHQRSDSLTSAAAFLGISLSLVAGPGWEAADDWAALFASGIIAFNGSRLLAGTWHDILDAAPDPEVVRRIRSAADAVPGVDAIDKCRVRRSGLGLFVDIHVVVDGDLPVRTGHAIAHRVKDLLKASDLQVLDAVVHVEPRADRPPPPPPEP